MMQGLVPSTTTAENKLKWGLTFQRLILLSITFIASAQIATLVVHLYLQLVFPIVCVIIAFMATQRDPINPNKKVWEGITDYYYSLWVQPKKYISITGSAYALHREEETKC